MTRKMLVISLFLVFITALGFRYGLKHNARPQTLLRSDVYKNKIMAFCSPDWSILNIDSLGNTMIPLPGWGDYRWNITTSHDSANFYFNQGINMYYAFHIIESMASFKKAGQFDDTNPLIYWAQALAFGPNINDFAYVESREALALALKAKTLSTNSSPKEKALIDAMLVRYSADTTLNRATLNARYGEEMKKVYLAFNNDADAGALYADAILVQHPWEYWKHNGDPHPWTPEILIVLEKTLQILPDHPGANHYYIHATEASNNPGRALASADRLGRLMPEVSHMVHMPSHIYIRTGNYDKGVRVNEMSVNGYNNYLKLYPAVVNNMPLYLIHNVHMQAACAMYNPNYAYAYKSALAARTSFDTAFMSLAAPLGNFVQYVYMTPEIVNVRYGKWSEIMQAEKLPDNFVYAKILWHWAQGLANANTGRIQGAKEHLIKMKKKMRDPDLKVILTPFNSVHSSALIAEKLLEGTILEKTGDMKKAIAAYREAKDFEDALIYTEPRDWLIPTRHYLANALIKVKEYAEADKLLKQDLKQNPANYYALQGLLDISIANKKNKEADSYKQQLKEVYRQPDVKEPSLLY